MIIIYDPASMSVKYTVNQYAPEFPENIAKIESMIDWDGLADVRQIRLASVDGNVVVSILPVMPIVPPDAMRLGVESVFSNVPESAAIFVNGAASGLMDSTGLLEFTPETDGIFSFRFTHLDFVAWEARLEAVAV